YTLFIYSRQQVLVLFLGRKTSMSNLLMQVSMSWISLSPKMASLRRAMEKGMGSTTQKFFQRAITRSLKKGVITLK
ncbi:MAG: hypothetical protein ABIT23_00165, partial [Nitrosospira sp.]